MEYPDCFPKDFESDILPKDAKAQALDNTVFFSGIPHSENLFLDYVFNDVCRHCAD